MAINGVSGVGGFSRPAPVQRPSLTEPGTAGTNGTGKAAGGGFADQISDALASVQQSQEVADGLAQQAATGDLSDIHDYMIASTQAQLATDLTVAVRNKALESFQSIMQMQV